MNPADDPIPANIHDTLNELARLLDEAFHPLGFALLVFETHQPGEAAREGILSYISNAQRGDILDAMREFIARNSAPGTVQ